MRLANVHVRYRDRTITGSPVSALKDVSVTIGSGEKVGVIGGNGTGKSTLLRVMAGVLRPDAGSFESEGMSTALLSLSAGFDAELSGVRNIVLHGVLSGLSPRDAQARVANIADLAGLGEAIQRRVATYSTGMRARLCFWTAINLDPDLMLIDEVLSVGDQAFREKSRKAMLDVMQGTKAVALVSHNLNFVERLCDRVIWLKDGAVALDGEATEVIHAYRDWVAGRSNPGGADEAAKKRIFVCGTGRSGTTALARLLNTHPDIVVGIERYKSRLMTARPSDDLTELFTKERYFEVTPGDTNIDLERSYLNDTAKARRKYDSAKYVGDKVPNLYRRLDFLDKAFPECVVIYIVRDPVSVAASWQRRATAADDAWPEENDFQRAVADWNESIRLAIQAKRVFGRRILYVSYDRVFGRRKWAVWREIMRNLDLDPELTTHAKRFLAKAAVRAKPKRDVPVHLRNYVNGEADYAKYSKLMCDVL
ncbi:MAG: sulfotransferase [Gammaproteobacteria bacterium]|nr:sulfotransferase [Gammaproteobacteria bacterium]